ncbi:MAG TPA: ABC transporter substrate-binding protein [Caldilineae bacterium]|nr:ABC transporter substrate-binding protein [Caldilineae bacterium]
MSRKHHKLFLLIAAVAMLAILVVACAPPAGQPAAKEKPVIKFAENPWSGSAVNVAVAKILLEEQLGYPVETTTLDENAQWTALASGDLHASLEVWPSGHAENVAEYIDGQKVVENGGLLGPVGVIGWFTPKYMIDQHPEFATWEGFADPELAKLYATAETGDKAQFLAGDPSWVQYEDQIIPNLGLSMEVVVAGSEEAILAALDAAYSREDPILFYFWTPHSIFAKYDLVQVELPPYSDECYAKIESGGVDCAYPSDDLFKIFWSGLKDYAPDAYTFLKNFNYTTQDQIEMIAAVELEDKSPEEAARAWIEANEDTWKAWLP